MNDAIITDPARRHDFLLLFDVADGNPNGDPDAGNMPRVDPETGHGLVTDVCLKRKIRNFVALDKEGIGGYNIYVREKAILSQVQGQAYKALGLNAPPPEDDAAEADVVPEKAGDKGKKKPRKAEEAIAVGKARDWMCQNFFDIRAFGAVMSLKENNAGQVRGPLQLTFGRSVDPIAAMDVSITRMAVATEKEAEAQGGDNRTMGRKAILPYALYVAKGFFTPSFAKQTGVTADDLAVVWRALEMMWDIDHSAARGMMACRGLYIFSHDNPLGNAPAHKLFDKLSITKKPKIESPRRFADYEVLLTGDLPGGVTLTPQVEG